MWGVGEHLRAPAFQNTCIDSLRRHYRTHNIGKAEPHTFGTVYRDFREGTKIRKLFSHVAARLGPLQRYKEGSEEHTEWVALFREQPELVFDIATMAGKDWQDTYPGDDEYRSLYLEEEVSLEDKWEKQILAFRNIDAIKAKAKERCVWSMIELDHLERKKPNVNGAA